MEDKRQLCLEHMVAHKTNWVKTSWSQNYPNTRSLLLPHGYHEATGYIHDVHLNVDIAGPLGLFWVRWAAMNWCLDSAWLRGQQIARIYNICPPPSHILRENMCILILYWPKITKFQFPTAKTANMWTILVHQICWKRCATPPHNYPPLRIFSEFGSL